jgi:BASS family bile acid:Na+ symporter
MSMAAILGLALKASIVLTVFALGLQANFRDATYLVQHPGQFFRSFLAMAAVMPLFAGALAAAFDLRPVVMAALIAFAVSPVPPILPKKEIKAGGHARYAIALLITAALLAIVFVPLAVTAFAWFFGASVSVPPHKVAAQLFVGVLAPLLAGVAIARGAPAFAARIAGPLGLVAMGLLVLSVLPVMIAKGPEMVALIGEGSLLVMAVFVAVALAVGHALGGPTEDDRTVLALSTASRHPGIALAVTAAAVADPTPALAAILVFTVVAVILTTLYVIWRRRRVEAPEGVVKA